MLKQRHQRNKRNTMVYSQLWSRKANEDNQIVVESNLFYKFAF